MKSKSRKAELKQQVEVNLEKYGGMFCHDSRCNIRFIFIKTKPGIFRIPKNQSIPNTPSRCLNFSLSIEDLSNLNCWQEKVRKR